MSLYSSCKSPRTLLLILGLLFSFGVASFSVAGALEASTGFELRSGDLKLTVRAQTPAEAYGHLVGVLGDMEFYRANGYDVALPDHSAFASVAVPDGAFEVFESEIYEAGSFERAIKILGADLELLQEALEWFEAAADVEGFHRFDHYEVTLTLYGSGGSYDPESGTIILLTNPEGRFKGGGGTHTIVHEMMHLAIEDGLVQRFGLSHWEKERLVDLLVQREFAEPFPDYKLQSQGVSSIDRYLVGVPLSGVATALERYRSDALEK